MRAFALVCLLALPSAAHAHSLSFGVLRVTETHGGARVLLRAGGSEGAPPSLVLEARGCALRGAPAAHEEGLLLLEGALACPAGLDGAVVRVHGLDDDLHLVARVERLDGSVQSALLDGARPELVITPSPSALDVAARYAELGVEHILAGLDHLLFLLALLLVSGPSLRRALLAVTGFTVGHSVTLSLAALGALTLPPAPVEVCIALSIVLLATELIRPGPHLTARRPALVAAGFGLVHGLGFAGALAEHGLPEGHALVALGAFNVGVEVGQIAFVTVAFAPLALLRTRGLFPRALPWVARAIGLAGAVWLGARLDAWLA